jgi:Cdc6-like AAA superfamily ATPase
MNASLTYEKEGRPLAVIKGGKQDKKLVSLTTGDDEKSTTKIELPLQTQFQLVPDTSSERSCVYIFGPSGSGKTTFTSNYLKEYKKLYKKNPIYLFSAVDEDSLLDDLGVKRIRIDDELLSSPIQAKDFIDGVKGATGSVVVFDDIDVLDNKKIKEAVYNILNQCLEIGRHHNITVIFTNHLATNGRETRRVLNESHQIVYFPHSGAKRQVEYLLEEYAGLDKKDIKAIKKSGSRWCCIFKNYPQMVMTDRSLRLLSADDD